jgi:DNA-binding transcriptional MerR regulator
VTKGPEAFRTISEAADELGVPQHVLRFWETKFSFIRPMKRAGGRRFYRPQDLVVLKGVRTLLHDDGYTIKGVQRLHKEQGVKRLLAAGHGETADGAHGDSDFDEGVIDQGAEAALDAKPMDQSSEQRLRDALSALEAAKARLARALSED